MIDQKLLSHIEEQLDSGVDNVVIRKSLLQADYKLEEIDQAITIVLQRKNNPQADYSQINNQIVNQTQQSQEQAQFQQKQLPQQNTVLRSQNEIDPATYNNIVRYIQNELRAGYKLEDIRIYLLRYYPKQIIDSIVINLSQKEKNRKLNRILIFSFLLLLILSSGIFSIYYFISLPIDNHTGSDTELTNKKIEKNLEFSFTLNNNNNILQQGSKLFYTLNGLPAKMTKNKEKNNQENVVIDYNIINTQTDEIKESWKTNLDGKQLQNLDKKQEYKLADDFTVGNYKLVIKITAENTVEEDSHKFKVIYKSQEANCFDSIKNQNELETDCGGICKKQCFVELAGELAFKDKESVKDEQDKQKQDKQEQIFIISQGSADKQLYNDAFVEDYAEDAKSFCIKIKNNQIKDDCFSEIAKKNNDQLYCNEIEKENNKDICFFNLATTVQESVCNEIFNLELKKSCINMRDVQKIQELPEKLKEQRLGSPNSYKNFVIIEENKKDKKKEIVEQDDSSTEIEEVLQTIIINDVDATIININNDDNNGQKIIKVTWKTNIAADSTLKYGLQSAVESAMSYDAMSYELDAEVSAALKKIHDTSPVYIHEIEIKDTAAGEYIFFVNSSNSHTSVESEGFSFVIT